MNRKSYKVNFVNFLEKNHSSFYGTSAFSPKAPLAVSGHSTIPVAKASLHNNSIRLKKSLYPFSLPYGMDLTKRTLTCSAYAPEDGFSDVTQTLNNAKFYNQCFDKGRLKNFVLWFLLNHGEHKTVKLVEQLKNVGFDYARKAGISLGLDDLKIPPKKTELIYDAENQTQLTVNQYIRGEITGVERFQRLIDTWHRTSEILKQEVIEYFEATDVLNPVYMMAFSGARGNISQVRQLVGMRGLMADPQGQIIDFPIRSNFREGLTVTEYIISSYGARKGIVDTALRTANAGYLTRRLVDVAQHVIISKFDCGTRRGIFLIDMKEGNKTIHSLTQRAVGRILARDLYLSSAEDTNTSISENNSMEKKIPFASRNEEITADLAFSIGKKFEKIFVRSALTCETSKLICQLCYGWSLAQGNLVSIGEAVGVVAAQSIGEPGTQLTMRTFHTGGVFSGDISDQIRAPFDGIVEYVSAIPGTLIRTPEGKIAFLTKGEGSFFVRKSNEGNANSTNSARSESVMESKKYKIPFYTLLYLRNGQRVYEKEVIAQISSISRKKNATDDAELIIKSEFEGQFYSKSLAFREKQVGPKPRPSKTGEKNKLTNSLTDDSSGTTVDLKATVSESMLKIQKNLKHFEENKGIDTFFEAWTWGYSWILSGKIYELKYSSPFFPRLGDSVNITSTMNQTKWRFNTNTGSTELYFSNSIHLLNRNKCNFSYGSVGTNSLGNKSLGLQKELPNSSHNRLVFNSHLMNANSSYSTNAYSANATKASVYGPADQKNLMLNSSNMLVNVTNQNKEFYLAKRQDSKRMESKQKTLNPFIAQPVLSLELNKIRFKKSGYILQLSEQNQFYTSIKSHSASIELQSPKTIENWRNGEPLKAGKTPFFKKLWNQHNKQNIKLSAEKKNNDLLFYLKSLNSVENNHLYPYILQWFPALFQTSTGGFVFVESFQNSTGGLTSSAQDKSFAFQEVKKDKEGMKTPMNSIKTESFQKYVPKNKYLVNLFDFSQTKQTSNTTLLHHSTQDSSVQLSTDSSGEKITRNSHIFSTKSTLKKELMKQNLNNSSITQNAAKTKKSFVTDSMAHGRSATTNSIRGAHTNTQKPSTYFYSEEMVTVKKHTLFGMRWTNSYEIWSGLSEARMSSESPLVGLNSSRVLVIPNQFYKLNWRRKIQTNGMNSINGKQMYSELGSSKIYQDKITFSFKKYAQLFNSPFFIVTNRQGLYKPLFTDSVQPFSLLKANISSSYMAESVVASEMAPGQSSTTNYTRAAEGVFGDSHTSSHLHNVFSNKFNSFIHSLNASEISSFVRYSRTENQRKHNLDLSRNMNDVTSSFSNNQSQKLGSTVKTDEKQNKALRNISQVKQKNQVTDLNRNSKNTKVKNPTVDKLSKTLNRITRLPQDPYSAYTSKNMAKKPTVPGAFTKVQTLTTKHNLLNKFSEGKLDFTKLQNNLEYKFKFNKLILGTSYNTLLKTGSSLSQQVRSVQSNTFSKMNNVVESGNKPMNSTIIDPTLLSNISTKNLKQLSKFSKQKILSVKGTNVYLQGQRKKKDSFPPEQLSFLTSFCKKTFIPQKKSLVSNYLVNEFNKLSVLKNPSNFSIIMADGQNFKQSLHSLVNNTVGNPKSVSLNTTFRQKHVLMNKEKFMTKMSFVSYTSQKEFQNSLTSFVNPSKNINRKRVEDKTNSTIRSGRSGFGENSLNPKDFVHNNVELTLNSKKGWVYVSNKINVDLHKQVIYPGNPLFYSGDLAEFNFNKLNKAGREINGNELNVNKRNNSISFDKPVYLEYVLCSEFKQNQNTRKGNVTKRNTKTEKQVNETVSIPNSIPNFKNFTDTVKSSKSRYYFNKVSSSPSLSTSGFGMTNTNEPIVLLIQPMEEYNQYDFRKNLNKNIRAYTSTTLNNKFKTLHSTKAGFNSKCRMSQVDSKTPSAKMKSHFMMTSTSLTSLNKFNNIQHFKNQLKGLLNTTVSSSNGVDSTKAASKAKKPLLVNKSFDSLLKWKQYRTVDFNKQTLTAQPVTKFPNSDIFILQNNLFQGINHSHVSVDKSNKQKSLRDDFLEKSSHFNMANRFLVSRKPVNLSSFIVSYTKPFGLQFSFKYTTTSFAYKPLTRCESRLDPLVNTKFVHLLSSYFFRKRMNVMERNLTQKMDPNQPLQKALGAFTLKNEHNLADLSVSSIYSLIPRLFESPCFSFYLVSNLNTNFFNTRYGKQKRITSSTKFLYSYTNKMQSNQPIAKTNYYSPFNGEIVYMENALKKIFLAKSRPFDDYTTNRKNGTENVSQGNSNVTYPANALSCMVLTKADLISYYLPSKFKEYKEILTMNQKNKYVMNDVLVQFLNMTDINLTNLQPYLKNQDVNKTNLKISKLVAGPPQRPYSNLLGDFFVYGDQISKTMAVQEAGQIVHYNNNKITLRRSQPIFISPKGILHKFDGDFIDPKTPVITLSYQRLKTGDIIQGIPKVEQFFEARTTKRGRLFRDSLPSLLKALFKRYKAKLPLDVAVRQSFYKIQQIIVDGVQRVYKSQGVTIADKHLEVIVKQMTSKVRIIDGSQTGFFPGEVVDLEFVEKINSLLIKKITYEPLVLGITKASLEVDSFLSAASFQQTTRVLSKAAISRKKDFLKGLKENVILGNLIPAGTGFLVYLEDYNK